MRFLLSLSAVLFFSMQVLAQADFTRQLLSSGRYDIKKQDDPKPVKSRRPASETGVVADPAPAKVESPAAAAPQSAAPVQAIEANPASIAGPVAEKVAESVENDEEPGVVDQVKSLFAEDDSLLERYQERVHPEDPRLNRLEIEGRSILSTAKSSSNYSFRDYNTSYPAMDLRSSVWMAPGFGLTGSIRFSLGASVAGDTATGSMDPVRDEELEMGLRFRRYFGLSRLSPSFEFDVIYLDHSFNVSTDSVSRPRWKTSGLGFGLKSRMPVSADRAWILGGRIFPRLQHQESKTSVAASSGESRENIRFDLEGGTELVFGRGHQVLLGLQLGAERYLFDGSADPMDPVTGLTPSNVTVTNSFLNFSFGYRWGR